MSVSSDMTNDNANLQRPLRVWPGVVMVLLLLLLRFFLPIVYPEGLYIGVLGGVIAGLAIVIWWLFFSRAPWVDRLGAIALMILALLATSRIIHESIARGGMGMLFPILAIPVLSVSFVAWAVLSRRLTTGARRVSMVLTIVLACGVWTLLRTGGFTGDFDHDFHWRWTETPEERLLAQSNDKRVALPKAPAPAKTAMEEVDVPPATTQTRIESQGIAPQTGGEPATVANAPVETEAEWPGFRGPERNSIVRGIRIKTDWSASPPVEMWRRPIGPGWSSFAVHGDLLYTQEQRGEEEVVSCYKTTTGEPVWAHRDMERFWESNAGAGPRATPTFSNGRVYTFGATGILNALKATDGTVVWSRNAASDAKTEIPFWGFSSSPLVVDNLVVVAAAGKLVAYDIDTGNPRWFGPERGMDYSSPHLFRIDGISQIVLLSEPGAISVAPATGAVLWKHELPKATRIVQPAWIADGDVLITDGNQQGMRRIAVANGSGGWTVKEQWKTNGLKPYFSDFVIHDGHAFGFDGSFLSCIDLKDGQRKWKGGRYGQGQLILLVDQDLILVLSEKGELALVRASTDQFTELAKVPAIEGKTWNHPVLTGHVLLVRNGEEMAAFRLPLAGR